MDLVLPNTVNVDKTSRGSSTPRGISVSDKRAHENSNEKAQTSEIGAIVANDINGVSPSVHFPSGDQTNAAVEVSTRKTTQNDRVTAMKSYVLPTHEEDDGLYVFITFHLMIIFFTVAFIVTWSSLRGLRHCEISHRDIRNHLEGCINSTKDCSIDLNKVSFALSDLNVDVPAIIIPEIVYHAFWDWGMLFIFYAFHTWSLVVCFWGQFVAKALALWFFMGLIPAYCFARYYAYHLEEGSSDVWAFIRAMVGSMSFPAIFFIMSIDYRRNQNEWRKRIKSSNEGYSKKAYIAGWKFIQAQLIFVILHRLIWFSAGAIRMFLKEERNKKLNGIEKYISMGKQMLILTFLFSYVLPFSQQVFTRFCLRFCEDIWDFRRELVVEEGDSPELTHSRKTLFLTRVKHYLNVFFDGYRYALGRGILLEVSGILFVSVLLKDVLFHFWHFAVKQDIVIFVLRAKLFHPGGRRSLKELNQKENKIISMSKWFPLISVITRFGDYIPNCVSLSSCIEIDFHKYIHSHHDGYLPFPGVTHIVEQSLLVNNCYCRSRRLKKSNTVTVKEVVPGPSGNKCNDINNSSDSEERGVDIAFDFANCRFLVKGIPSWIEMVNIEMEKQIKDPRHRTTKNRFFPTEVRNEETVALRRILKFYRYETWMRYQSRMMVRLLMSLQMVLVPLIGSLIGSLTSTVSDFAFFPKGSELSHAILVGLIFLVVDLFEWYYITYNFHWTNPEDRPNHVRWWYQTFHVHSWDKMSSEFKLTSEKPHIREGVWPLLFPWGFLIISWLLYVSLNVYVQIWDPLNEIAINKHFGLDDILMWKHLNQICR